jgi:5-methylcytosine-specific restriction endonuclease McrA
LGFVAAKKTSKIPAPVRRRVRARDGLRCVYCGRGGRMHLDHVIPRVEGGKSVEGNLLVACARCNLRKGTMDLDLFAIWLERRTGEPSAAILARVAAHLARPVQE